MDGKYFHSVILKADKCFGCTSCLKVCPTEAIRLRDDKAAIIGERCIDCGECIRICPSHAKSAVTDSMEILKNFKYTIAIPTMVIYGQFPNNPGIGQINSAIKKVGFDEVYENTFGAEIISNVISNHILKKPGVKRPLISSSCPAILRLIQLRFPDLLENVVDIDTPVEISARIAKLEAVKKTGLRMEDIGVIYITPCTAKVTSIRNPLGIAKSYLDGAVSMKDIYGAVFRNLSGSAADYTARSHRESLMWSVIEGESGAMGLENYLAVDGIKEVMKILEDIEMGKLDDLEFLEGMACIGGCVGGPLTLENPFIARNRLKALSKELPTLDNSKADEEYINMYESGFIKLTEKIEPRSILKLDDDIEKSMKKMEMIKEILRYLPGLDCGVCGAPTCRAFAEDIVKGENPKAICIVKTMQSYKGKKN